MRVILLGTGGGAPSAARETSCVLVREDDRAVLLDAGTGARRLLADGSLLDGISRIDVVLTHFHFDHVAGLPYLQWLGIEATVWAPGVWLYDTASVDILAPLQRPPICPSGLSHVPVRELQEGTQLIGGFNIRASAQPRHCAPSAGVRVGDHLAYITDTPYEGSSAELARGVQHLLHEAWSSSTAPEFPDQDATAADAARVACEAGAVDLTLIHLNPNVADLSGLLDDARLIFEPVAIGDDTTVLT